VYGTSPNKDRSWFHTVVFAAILSLTPRHVEKVVAGHTNISHAVGEQRQTISWREDGVRLADRHLLSLAPRSVSPEDGVVIVGRRAYEGPPPFSVVRVAGTFLIQG